MFIKTLTQLSKILANHMCLGCSCIKTRAEKSDCFLSQIVTRLEAKLSVKEFKNNLFVLAFEAGK